MASFQDLKSGFSSYPCTETQLKDLWFGGRWGSDRESAYGSTEWGHSNWCLSSCSDSYLQLLRASGQQLHLILLLSAKWLKKYWLTADFITDTMSTAHTASFGSGDLPLLHNKLSGMTDASCSGWRIPSDPQRAMIGIKWAHVRCELSEASDVLKSPIRWQGQVSSTASFQCISDLAWSD